MKIRFGKIAFVSLAVAAIAAPGAGAYVATGDGGGSAAQVATGDSGLGGSQVSVETGSGQNARTEQSSGGSDSRWLSVLLATTALAGLGGAGAAMSRKRGRERLATLTI